MSATRDDDDELRLNVTKMDEWVYKWLWLWKRKVENDWGNGLEDGTKHNLLEYNENDNMNIHTIAKSILSVEYPTVVYHKT